jgi:hypothetical protein
MKAIITLIAGTLLITGFIALGCQRSRTQKDRPTGKPTLEKIIASSPDTVMQNRWKASERTLPPVGEIVTPTRPVVARSRGSVAADQPNVQRPTIPADSKGAVRTFSQPGITRYSGPFTISESVEGRMTGTLGDPKSPLEIVYRLPGKSRKIEVDRNAPMNVDFLDEVDNNTLQRHTVLSTNKGDLKLLYVSEGGRKSVRMDFKNPPLSIRQIPGKNEDDGSVEVTYRGEKAAARIGEKTPLGELTLFVISCISMNPQSEPLLEGDPFHVTLIIY